MIVHSWLFMASVIRAQLFEKTYKFVQGKLYEKEETNAKIYLKKKTWTRQQKVLRRLQICPGASPCPPPRQQTTPRPSAWQTGSCRCAWARRDPRSVGAVAGFAWTWQEEEQEEKEKKKTKRKAGWNAQILRKGGWGGAHGSVHWEADCDSGPDSCWEESGAIWKWNEEELGGESKQSAEKGESH